MHFSFADIWESGARVRCNTPLRATAQEEEKLWTELIDTYQGVEADWVPDIVGRCSFAAFCCARS